MAVGHLRTSSTCSFEPLGQARSLQFVAHVSAEHTFRAQLTRSNEEKRKEDEGH